MIWPNHSDESEPKRDSTGALVITEVYWPYGIIKFAIGLIAFGFYWSVRDLTGSEVLHWMNLPGYAIGVWGLSDWFYRRRFHFWPLERKVSVSGFSLWRGRFSAQFSYEDVGCEVHRRWVFGRPIHKRYFAMFYFPGIEVAFFSSPNEAEATAALERLRSAFALDPARTRPKPPRPVTRDWMGRPCN